ncbi:hypothetical protein GH714_037959 [Hevea brasiliensis]|uniref:Rad51-like C-terminal domain-containing protein n=1 Tax=Hevea brasiliensis TaxID=3981 RepID=A0A6A6KAT9_HEVBR|nr:hypothetical protein GH714_037959 [Hevea brasiliensis]
MEQQRHQKMVQQQQHEEVEEMQHGPFPVEQLQESGIAALDVKKLKDAGLCTVESVAYSPRKELLQIKGISEAKVDKIIEAGMSFLHFIVISSKLVPLGFTSASQLHAQRAIFWQEELRQDLLLRYMASFALARLNCATHSVSLAKSRGGEGKAMYIDAEGTFRPQRLLQIADRFGLNGADVLENVAYARAYNTDHHQGFCLKQPL